MSRQQLNILIDYTILPKISTYRKEFVIFFESKYYVQSELTDVSLNYIFLFNPFYFLLL